MITLECNVHLDKPDDSQVKQFLVSDLVIRLYLTHCYHHILDLVIPATSSSLSSTTHLFPRQIIFLFFWPGQSHLFLFYLYLSSPFVYL